jgi:hypothetical protein
MHDFRLANKQKLKEAKHKSKKHHKKYLIMPKVSEKDISKVSDKH